MTMTSDEKEIPLNKYNNDKWSKIYNSMCVRITKNVVVKSKIAAFDFDCTLFTTSSGKKFPKTENDLSESTLIDIQKLKSLSKTHTIVIISNQGVVGKHMTLYQVQHRLGKAIDILKTKGIETITLFSLLKDNNRKPRIGMWKYVLYLLNHDATYLDDPSIEIIDRDYLYVGDAAGRPAGPDRKPDFAPTDLFFANNCRIKFMTPEEFGVPYKLKSVIYPIRSWYRNYLKECIDRPSMKDQLINKFNPTITKQYLVLMVGFPGSSKSTIAKAIMWNVLVPLVGKDTTQAEVDSLPTSVPILSKDTTKSIPAFNKILNSTILEGECVIIDNCNASLAGRTGNIDRAKYINPNIHTVIIWIKTSMAMAYHLNNVRASISNIPVVPMVAYHVYNKSFVAPCDTEVDELITIEFVPEFATAQAMAEFLREY